jgi:hypothetical protein
VLQSGERASRIPRDKGNSTRDGVLMDMDSASLWIMAVKMAKTPKLVKIAETRKMYVFVGKQKTKIGPLPEEY